MGGARLFPEKQAEKAKAGKRFQAPSANSQINSKFQSPDDQNEEKKPTAPLF
jgi:hypothetical protein